MHMIAIPSVPGVSRNFSFGDHNATSSTFVQTDLSNLPWYMAEWTTPVTAVLEAYVLISFLVFLVMVMMCIHRRGCFHICRRRRRRRPIRYQQLPRHHVWHEEQTNDMHEDSDEDVNHYGVNSSQSTDPHAVDTENSDDRVQDIQRLERALRVAGMA
ncbi:hypothetical protein QM012_003554 [Aureobasidium pullulans]|uniref:Uncharacterized protein n=1 Tax=Aureobasidium pullulans TaxID=5580 RepID=A0ABR0T8S4_AURPU